MRIIGIIGFQSLQLIIKEKTSMIWMLIVPCIYIFVFGSAFRGGGDPAQSRADLAVYNQDNGFLSGELIKGLQSENLDVDSLSLSPEEHPTRMLHIPENFTEQVLKGKEVTLTFSKKPDTHIEAAATAEMAIRKAYIRILANLTEISMSGKKEHPGAFQ